MSWDTLAETDRQIETETGRDRQLLGCTGTKTDGHNDRHAETDGRAVLWLRWALVVRGSNWSALVDSFIGP